ncbi:MAG: ATP-binding cassette domain-containing protein, partial [Pseudomonadales bacterium]
MIEPLLRVDAVSKTYRQSARVQTVLEAVSLELMPGQVLALVGRSGSGKSTLLNIVAGLDLPDSGAVRYCIEGA